MSPLLDMQVRFRELGRIRAGEKGAKGEPRKLANWRLTSASRPLLEQAATLFGGEVQEWAGAPDEGFFEVYTDTDRLDVMIPPVSDAGTLLSQHYELWSGGGAVRRCDGLVESLSGKACLCDPADRQCKPVTRLSVMIPALGGIGVWRLDTGGVNAALELPGAFNLIVRAADGQFMPAVLRLEQRSQKREGQTRRFAVPVLDMEQATMLDLVSGQAPGVLGPAFATGKPELPPAGRPPNGAAAAFNHGGEVPELGPRPDLPSSGATTIAAPSADAHPSAVVAGAELTPTASVAPVQDPRINELVDLLRSIGARVPHQQIAQNVAADNWEWFDKQIARAKEKAAMDTGEAEAPTGERGS